MILLRSTIRQSICVERPLPDQQEVYPVKVVIAFLRAGIPLSKLDSFSDILEENTYHLPIGVDALTIQNHDWTGTKSMHMRFF